MLPLFQTRRELLAFLYSETLPALSYLCFWGHTPQNPSRIGKECLSQWYQSPFCVGDVQYSTAEHYMMAEKARLFEDEHALQQILTATSPGAAKDWGRRVQGFENERWVEYRYNIVVEGNRAKFGQHPELQDYLLKTGNRILVEASPHDRIWGVGLSAQDERIHDPAQWRGLNMLGFALMKVRAELQQHQRIQEAD